MLTISTETDSYPFTDGEHRTHRILIVINDCIAKPVSKGKWIPADTDSNADTDSDVDTSVRAGNGCHG